MLSQYDSQLEKKSLDMEMQFKGIPLKFTTIACIRGDPRSTLAYNIAVSRLQRKEILPFVTTYNPAVPNPKKILMNTALLFT